MAQIEHGIRKLLSLPWIYNSWGFVLGADRATKRIVERYLMTSPGDQVFDIGCGTGRLLEAFPENIKYTGFDLSPSYIQAAREKYGERGRFLHADVESSPDVDSGSQDLAVSTGVLHHLDDLEALELFALALRALRPGGKLVTLDSVYVEGQSKVARYLISRDRGQNVRDVRGYLDLAGQVFENVEFDIRHDLLRVPYTHIIITCTKQDS